jgi:hypothetical protein
MNNQTDNSAGIFSHPSDNTFSTLMFRQPRNKKIYHHSNKMDGYEVSHFHHFTGDNGDNCRVYDPQ